MQFLYLNTSVEQAIEDAIERIVEVKRENQETVKKKKLGSITISPAEPEKSEEEELLEFEQAVYETDMHSGKK